MCNFNSNEIEVSLNEYTIDKLMKICKSYHNDYANNIHIKFNNILLSVILILLIINMMFNIAHFCH